ncbi:MAG: zf-HC2 domain-containing protein [Bryobacteraceae bacterium]|nr:zf-HC2 domain-containing protein [Bryobacteraceae bacterium]
MSCSPFDLKDFFFGELPPTERSTVEKHLGACPECREELAALTGTRAALMSVADEEPPRRIAFVSDKVFEPRWWQRLWASGPGLGFAAAAMLALAIVVHGFAMRPVTITTTKPATAPLVDLNAEVDRRVKTEVARIMAENESAQTGKVLEVVNARLRQSDQKNHQVLWLIRESLERMDKRNAMVVKRASYDSE